MNLIIWSKDRAAQLDMLLTSIKEKTYLKKIYVIYKASSDFYEDGYDLLIRYHNNVNFICQYSDSLENMTKNLLISLAERKEKYVGFSTDDMVVYRDFLVPETDITYLFESGYDVFSMRLGFNTIVQNTHEGTFQPALHRYVTHGDFIGWNWRDYYPLDNYGYPSGLDMHFFPLNKIQPLIESFSWATANELESGLFYRKDSLGCIFSPKQSVAVNIPVNNMSGITISGKTYSYHPERLNELFLNKVRFKYRFNKEIIGCHQEFPIDQIS